MKIDPSEYYRLRVLQKALWLECQGMKRSCSPSAYSVIKKEFGFRGSKEKVHGEFSKMINELVS
jgi:hypothetical protein